MVHADFLGGVLTPPTNTTAFPGSVVILTSSPDSSSFFTYSENLLSPCLLFSTMFSTPGPLASRSGSGHDANDNRAGRKLANDTLQVRSHSQNSPRWHSGAVLSDS
jgi:hypothetical protein